MEKTISAADANRNFSKLLRGVRRGGSYVVTSHGQPVARIVPAETASVVAGLARTALISRLRRQHAAKSSAWTREELYDAEL